MIDPPETVPRPISSSRYAADDDRISLLLILSAIVRRIPFIASAALLTAAMALVFALASTRYVSTSRFQPAHVAPSSRLAGIASQFGFSMPGSDPGESIEFYSELLKSTDLLLEAAQSTFILPAAAPGGKERRGTLVEFYGIHADTREQATRAALRRLSKSVQVNSNAEANLLSLSTTADDPELAIAINARLLELVNAFNIEKRQSRASAERKFVEQRMAEAERNLRAAEGELQTFMERNRTYASSPQLSLEANRLQRKVDSAQQVRITLQQAYEQARIEEVRNTPVFTIIDAPRFAAKDRNFKLFAFLGLFVGTVLGTIAAFGIEAIQRLRRERPPEYQQLLDARRDLARRFRRRRKSS